MNLGRLPQAVMDGTFGAESAMSLDVAKEKPARPDRVGSVFAGFTHRSIQNYQGRLARK
ncbi:MAG: hypothetical protein LR011_03945 [Verrucomicrobia bacterium]|nr:hypothetical protein [Verrucomicrobiota bacterium]